MDRAEKQQNIEELNQLFKENSGVMLVDFTGLSVADETDLRRQIADADSSYRVVKNTLALRAAQETAVEALKEHFSGPTAIAYTQENPVGLAKTLTEFLKTHPSMSLKAGVLEESVLAPEEVKDLAKMPTREELLAKLAYLLQAPLTQLAAALQSPLTKLAIGLKQLSEKKEPTN